MITEDYVSFETTKLLKEKGFDESTRMFYEVSNYPSSTAKENFKKITGRDMEQIEIHSLYGLEDEPFFNSVQGKDENQVACPTLQMAMKWLRETHSILLVVDYDYECTDTSYCYKIYRLGEHGKPERVAIKGVSYDKDNNPTEHIVGWRDFELSYSDYGTYEEACEAAIKYCLENLI